MEGHGSRVGQTITPRLVPLSPGATVASLTDRRAPKQLPTYNQVDDCIDLLDKLYVKYNMLFKAEGLADGTLLPTWQYDWQSIFRVPWIPNGETPRTNDA